MEIPDPLSSVLKNKSADIWQTTPEAMVFDAIRLMSEKNVGALLVMNGGKLAGIVSERDYTRKVILAGKSSKDTPVSEIMTEEVITATPGEPVVTCMKAMTEKRIRHLPVLDGNGDVVGVVSIGDLVKWMVSAQSALIDQLESYITGSYPS